MGIRGYLFLLQPSKKTGPSTATKMTVPSTAEDNTYKIEDVKAEVLLLMALPMTSTYFVCMLLLIMFVAIKADLEGMKQLKKDTEGHTDATYENFNASSQNHLILSLTVSIACSLFGNSGCASSTNNINTVNPEVSIATTKVNTASTEIYTASFSDATVYAFLSTQPKGSQLVHEDLEQLHDDDLEEMDLKWNMALLSMRARKFYQRTGRKIIIDGSNTAGYDKSKVEYFNCHKMGHFARECRAPRSKDNRNWNQGSSSKAVKIEDASEKAMCAIDGAGFDWSDMAEEEIQANMALMAFSDSEMILVLRRRARVVLSEDDADLEDNSSKQGRKLSDAEVQKKASNETEPIIQEVTPTEVIQDQGSSEKGNSEVSTGGATKGTASEVPVVSTAEENISTAGRTVTYRRRSEEKKTRKDKGKAIMTESEPKKKSKNELEQEMLSFVEAIRLEEQMNEEQMAQIARDEEIARQWNEE
ncbi:ribonuclease H-like domain-containing protein, partial [Tanacetum coccineum]